MSKYIYDKGIGCSYRDVHTRSGKASVQLDMSAVCITLEKDGQQLIIDNDEFQKIISCYIAREKELKRVNK